MAVMNETEKQLIKHINKGSIAESKAILSSDGVNVNCTDESGMTPLMHAAYKGQIEIVELLLAHGADINSRSHESGYSTLMFGALSGNIGVVKILLQAGASVSKVNDIGRTAAQMAAFVGHHDVVSLINNFVSIDDLNYYTKPQGLEKVAKLESKLVPSLHLFVTMTNLNPVKLVLFLNNHMELVENYKAVNKVLGLKAESCIKQSTMNEVMAMKMHYFAMIVRTCGRWHEGLDGKDGINGLIKSLIRGRASDGFPMGTEDLLRQAIREFEYPQCTIFRQLVESLAKTEKGVEPTALTALTQAINGLQSADFSNACCVCGERRSVKKCAACKKVGYCSVSCQKLHWSTHKKHCQRLAKEYEQELLMEEEIKRQEELKEENEKKENETSTKEEHENINSEKKSDLDNIIDTQANSEDIGQTSDSVKKINLDS
ncbi:ankyrin repeat and MYND domain-containing protein 2 isoform X1 [Nematostella vectensis]|uniref:ankyrin repeat and MYND domain-containing protein 2 isoform X1 n=1 Tax=Nematostella vectensis TaxID=45351 RepID=UPI002076F6B1|nr:ankyrin repeat and MYND domain-containing protein 2 isoform X1 [Nematostella vectensis]